MSDKSYPLTSVKNQVHFTVTSFTEGSEKIYFNGLKLIKDIDYAVSASVIGQSTDTISLLSPRFESGVPADTDILEIIIPSSRITTDDIMDQLESIATAVLGSWLWDKKDSLLTMYDREGKEAFKYTVSDSSEEASRERRQDLEA